MFPDFLFLSAGFLELELSVSALEWQFIIASFLNVTGTVFVDSFEQKIDFGTKGEVMKHLIFLSVVIFYFLLLLFFCHLNETFEMKLAWELNRFNVKCDTTYACRVYKTIVDTN